MPTERLTVRGYHQQSSHRPDGYARGPEVLDWSGQPDPFRRFDGAPAIELPLLKEDTDSPDFNDLFKEEVIKSAPVNLNSVSHLLELSLGISAWKSYGPDRWALRCNPSSGNLHPTEGYIVASGIDGLGNGIYHYRADEHLLEQRARIGLNDHKPRLIIGLSSILWREGWKYGERAFRYCQLDIGHAIAAFGYAAATQGWKVSLLEQSDDAVATLLGLDQEQSFENSEPELPELLLEIAPLPEPWSIPETWCDLAAKAEWQGVANRLDPHPYGSWPVLNAIAQASRKEGSAIKDHERRPHPEKTPEKLASDSNMPAIQLIKQRRSAQAFDPRPLMPQDDFFRILDATLYRPGLPPWHINTDEPHTHLLLFVHRVEGLRQGLYALPRSANGEKLMREEMRESFNWEAVESAPEHLPLYALVYADCRRAAATLSCKQAIASDSAFALAMLGEFDQITAEPASYRQLFMEAGQIGQALYLEAEASGFRGTGIGCYFDEPVHETLGIESSALKSVYHFTVGMPLIDDRIETLPPYDHLERMKT